MAAKLANRNKNSKQSAGYTLGNVTELLQNWNSRDDEARSKLIDAIYAELTVIAARQLAKERHTIELQPNTLVHEAYLKLVDMNRVAWQNRAHFLAIAAKIMREILIDEARKRNAAKRDGGIRITLSGAIPSHADPATDALMLHEALERLAEADPDRAWLVELRFFGGLTIEETAEVMNSSPATVKRSWDVARGWLYRALQKDNAEQ
jgi:RNA polymerase sigma factor (TIGR02999 family)